MPPRKTLSSIHATDRFNPEVLLISAYIQQGSFTPERQKIEPSDFYGWGRLWKWAIDYQRQSGKAPPLGIVHKYFPEFDYTPDVSVDWAANQVRSATAHRELRAQLQASITALNAEDLDAAYHALDALKRPVARQREPVSVFDHTVVADSFQVSRIPVPFPSLLKATSGGIANSEFWLLGARLGAGKSWLMLMYAAAAAKAGYQVGFHALEMPAWQVARRSHQMLTDDPKILALLRSGDLIDHKKAIDHIQETVTGGIHIFDPSHGRINTTGAVADSCRQYDLVLIDHLGLMQLGSHRAIEDWRQMATISNICRETTLSTGTPIMASSQINRLGDTNSARAPKASTLSQSDAPGQDADVVLTMKRLNQQVMVHSGEKIRNGPGITWYSRFDPAANLFGEITKPQAERLSLEADDIASS